MGLKEIITAVTPRLCEFRHDLHAHPELSFEEVRTSQKVYEALRDIRGLHIQRGIAATGIVATLDPEKTGPCVALRGDMDALPIQETGDLPYASTIPGKMHACGHDGHTTCLLGAALVLSQVRDTLKGPVKFLFQPAEERGSGGRRMCEEGALEHPTVDAIFGIHGWPELSVGEIGVRAGPMLASVDDFSLTIEGKGSHAAWPHLSIDPIVISAHIVQALQTIISRNIDPLESGVITVARIEAGSANNIIPSTARLTGTIRALARDVRTTMMKRLTELSKGIAEAYGATAKVEFLSDGVPSVINDSRATALVTKTAESVLDKGAVHMMSPVMGAEDFAFYTERIPASFFTVGVRPKDQVKYPHLHQSTYNFSDEAIPVAVQMFSELALRFADDWKKGD